MVEPIGRTEQEYLDLAQSFKDRMEEKDREYRDIKIKYLLGKFSRRLFKARRKTNFRIYCKHEKK